MIRRRRESLGFSQARLGDLVGRSASTIRNWERGKSTPAAPADAVALAAVLGLHEGRVLEAAGFQTGEAETHQTVEQGYASLAPRPADDADGPAPGADGERASPPEPEVRIRPVPLPPGEPTAPGPQEAEPASRQTVEESGTSLESSQGDPEPVPPPPSIDPLPEEESQEQREVSRAAPPTVLEVASHEEPSYLEDPQERQRYRVRAVATAAVVVILAIVLLWSFDRATDALGTMWDEFVGMLEI